MKYEKTVEKLHFKIKTVYCLLSRFSTMFFRKTRKFVRPIRFRLRMFDCPRRIDSKSDHEINSFKKSEPKNSMKIKFL